jgi:hypothetical protein
LKTNFTGCQAYFGAAVRAYSIAEFNASEILVVGCLGETGIDVSNAHAIIVDSQLYGNTFGMGVVYSRGVHIEVWRCAFFDNVNSSDLSGLDWPWFSIIDCVFESDDMLGAITGRFYTGNNTWDAPKPPGTLDPAVRQCHVTLPLTMFFTASRNFSESKIALPSGNEMKETTVVPVWAPVIGVLAGILVIGAVIAVLLLLRRRSLYEYTMTEEESHQKEDEYPAATYTSTVAVDEIECENPLERSDGGPRTLEVGEVEMDVDEDLPAVNEIPE